MDEEEPLTMTGPNMDAVAFVCPHCSALAQQRWHSSFIAPMQKEGSPGTPSPEWAAKLKDHFAGNDDMLAYIDARMSPSPSVHSETSRVTLEVANVYMSRCLACRGVAIWLYDAIIWPQRRTYIAPPNPDMPGDARRDYEEAAAVATSSPRSAAALLRLAIEKLCRSLGKTGSIDRMIGELVAEGLSPRAQKALDVVRVVGNESVHPGTMDVSDSPETVVLLFKLVNWITEAMITEPRHLDEIYDALPPEKLKGIDQRNAKALSRPRSAEQE